MWNLDILNLNLNKKNFQESLNKIKPPYNINLLTQNAAFEGISKQENTKKIATTGDVNNNDNVDRHLCIFRCAGIYDSSRSALHTVYNNLLSKEEAEDSRRIENFFRKYLSKTVLYIWESRSD